MLSASLRSALDSKLLRLGDDEFILGHRNSEWTGHGPILEEDIAFANLALDELGHGILWYRIVALLRDEDPESYPDQLVYQRGAAEFQNVDFVALPHTDWAFSMLRQFLFDAYESIHVPALTASRFEPIAEAAAKIKQEEFYHLYHTKAWVQRLGLGTEESRRRMQTALDQLWTPFQQLFAPGPEESLLVDAGITADLGPVHVKWHEMVVPFLESCALVVPDDAVVPRLRQSGRSEHMGPLIAELQQVSKLAPGAVW
ncbi:MAG TPA: 1,2-phenylacetyl-CoA epoxidase subunit PaaC [Planctomycetaceae bacterium]|jgi:ring-1,2-phenylacetyl-CoA epoxidase subunit PaaC|nr:1,2-phenylacetyl-CoA epoxidase subunit PaaC [Planctomycetaceae bacterium]